MEKDSKIINRAIEDMPEQRRKVMRLRLDGLSNREIAEELGIVPGTVVNHYSAGMKDILEALEAAANPAKPGRSVSDDEV